MENSNLEKKTTLSETLSKFTFPVFILISLLLLFALVYQANSISAVKSNLAQSAADIAGLQFQLSQKTAELATQQDIEDLTERFTACIDDLHLMLDEVTPAPAYNFNPMILSDLTFEEACNLACSPNTPEEVLIYLATTTQNFVSSGEEYYQICALLLSNENSSNEILLPLIKETTEESLPLLASSKLHNEMSLYLMANTIRFYSQSSSGSGQSYVYMAAVNVLNNPALSKEAVNELSYIVNEQLQVLISSNTYTKP